MHHQIYVTHCTFDLSDHIAKTQNLSTQNPLKMEFSTLLNFIRKMIFESD